MNRPKCFPIMLLVCITMLVVSVCSASKSTAEANTDSKKLVIAAFEKLNTVKNYHMTMENNYTLTYQGEALNLGVKSEADAQTEPLLVKNNMIFTMESTWEKKEKRTMQYVEANQGQIVAYSHLNNQWTKQVITQFSPLAAYEDYVKAIKSVTLLKENAKTRDFAVVVESSYMSNELERMMNAVGMQKVKLPKGIFKDIGDLSYTVTIDKKTAAITKVNMDLSGLLVNVGKNIVESLEMPDEKKTAISEMLSTVKASATITFSQINRVEGLQIPPEVKNTAVTVPPVCVLKSCDSDKAADSIEIGASL